MSTAYKGEYKISFFHNWSLLADPQVVTSCILKSSRIPHIDKLIYKHHSILKVTVFAFLSLRHFDNKLL